MEIELIFINLRKENGFTVKKNELGWYYWIGSYISSLYSYQRSKHKYVSLPWLLASSETKQAEQHKRTSDIDISKTTIGTHVFVTEVNVSPRWL